MVLLSIHCSLFTMALDLLLTLVFALDGLSGRLWSLATLPQEEVNREKNAGEKDKGTERPSGHKSDLERGHVAGVGLGIRQFLLHDVFIENIKLAGSIGEVGAVVLSWLLEVLLHVGELLAKDII